ncbi:MAG: hypothetical protein NTW07_02815 [candidate division Zixibacteria bacterium]|nr:hypothetical protein [candidate division Zixibacteria bacterium]
MFKKIILWVFIIVVVALGATYFARNMLVERAVEAGSSYALGVQTNLGSARLELGGGSLDLNDLEIDNPEGFTAKTFLTLRRSVLDVDAGSVLDDEVVVDSLVIEGVTLNLEQVDKEGNYRVLLDHIKRLELSSSKEQQKFRIGLIALRDIQATGSLSLMGKKLKKSFSIENFTLRNVGSDNGFTVSQVTAKIVEAVVTKALTAGKGSLPDGFGQGLSGLKDQGVQKLESGVSDKLKDIGKSLTGGKK